MFPEDQDPYTGEFPAPAPRPDDGGPAFPSSIGRDVAEGISTRDAFAMAALTGLVSHTGSYGLGNGPGTLAQRSYEIADAMLAARSRT